MEKRKSESRKSNSASKSGWTWPVIIATTISVIALLMSIGQFVLDVPLILKQYLTPKIIVEERITFPVGGFFLAEVTNQGESKAELVDISVWAGQTSKITVIPDFGARITKRDRYYGAEHRIVVDHLLPLESFRIEVRTDLKEVEHIRRDMGKSATYWIEFPSVGYVRYKDGQGAIIRRPLDSYESLPGSVEDKGRKK